MMTQIEMESFVRDRQGRRAQAAEARRRVGLARRHRRATVARAAFIRPEEEAGVVVRTPAPAPSFGEPADAACRPAIAG